MTKEKRRRQPATNRRRPAEPFRAARDDERRACRHDRLRYLATSSECQTWLSSQNIADNAALAKSHLPALAPAPLAFSGAEEDAAAYPYRPVRGMRGREFICVLDGLAAFERFQQSTKIELIFNLKAGRTLGAVVPVSLLAAPTR